MNQRIAIKRLAPSDLTFFKHHYDNQGVLEIETEQKAIILDARKFLKKFYPDFLSPAFPKLVEKGKVTQKVPVSVSITGPGGAPAQIVQQTVGKSAKNWRLNGLVNDPPHGVGCYGPLRKGDFAIMEFFGEGVPNSVTVRFVAAAVPEDNVLHSRIHSLHGAKFNSATSMIILSAEQLEKTLSEAVVAVSGSTDFPNVGLLEDAANGGLLGLSVLSSKPSGFGITKEAFKKSKEKAEQTGRSGEELVNHYLNIQKSKGAIEDFEWISDENPAAAYDFLVYMDGKPAWKIDAKSTVAECDNPVHVSMNELKDMMSSDIPYFIYRLHHVSEGKGMLLFSDDIRDFAKKLHSLLKLPKGVVPDGFSISTALLKLSGEEPISIPPEDEIKAA